MKAIKARPIYICIIREIQNAICLSFCVSCHMHVPRKWQYCWCCVFLLLFFCYCCLLLSTYHVPLCIIRSWTGAQGQTSWPVGPGKGGGNRSLPHLAESYINCEMLGEREVLGYARLLEKWPGSTRARRKHMDSIWVFNCGSWESARAKGAKWFSGGVVFFWGKSMIEIPNLFLNVWAFLYGLLHSYFRLK